MEKNIIKIIFVIVFICCTNIINGQTNKKIYNSNSIEIFDGYGYKDTNLIYYRIIDVDIYFNEYSVIFFDNLKNETKHIYQILKIEEECVDNEDIVIYHMNNSDSEETKLVLIRFDDKTKYEYVKFLMVFSNKKEKIVWKTSNLTTSY